MMKNNKGVTLIELVIVVAILTVIVSASLIGFGFYSSYPAKQCANNLKTSLINGRIVALGKNDYKIYIGKETDGTVYIREDIDSGSGMVTGEKIKIGDKSVTVKYYVGTDPTPIVISNGNSISFSFKRETGGFDFGANPIITKIVVIKQKTFTLKLSRFTGKVTLE